MRKPPKPQGTWRHRILSQTQEAEVNKNALGIKMKHEKKTTQYKRQTYSLLLHPTVITMSAHYI